MANEPKNELKTIELWEGYEVRVNDALLKDPDYVSDFAEVQKEGNIREGAIMMFALLETTDGKTPEGIYNDVRDHLIEQDGIFSIDKLAEILVKIGDTLPKAGNRAQRRLWMREK